MGGSLGSVTAHERGGSLTKSIKIRLVEQGQTAVSVRESVGMSESTWHQRMREHRTWRLGELEDVAAALGTTVAELVSRA